MKNLTINQLNKRKKEIIELRFTKNKKTRRNFHTLEEIGKKYKITRERVRKIILKEIGNTGYIKDRITKTCKYCYVDFIVTNKSKQFLCSKKCRNNYISIIPGHPIREYTEEELRNYYKKRNERSKEYRKNYYQKNKKKILEYNQTPARKKYFKKYHKNKVKNEY